MPTCVKRHDLVFIAAWLVLIGLFSFVGARPAGAGELEAREILNKIDEAEGHRTMFGQVNQVITTSGGGKRTLVVRMWSVNNGEKQLALYLAPADIKGQKILMTDDGDNIWMFNPETRRTRKLGSHMKKKKVMGSDFTYEDQAGGKLTEKYTGRTIAEEVQDGTDCLVLELKPTPKGPGYSKVVIWVGRKDYLSRRIDFFENDAEEPVKRLTLTDVRTVGDKRVAFKMTMTNLEDRTETVNLIDRVQFGMEIPDDIFEPRNLDR